MAKTRRAKAEINVVPYIDVMLVLVVIFMVVSPSKQQDLIELDLPEAEAVGDAKITSDNLPAIVSIGADGLLYLNVSEQPREPLARDVIATKVAALVQLNPQQAVELRGDKAINYEQFLSVITLLNAAGVDNVGLSAAPPETN